MRSAFEHTGRVLLIASLLSTACLATSAWGAPANFEDDVAPILEIRCVKCHGAEIRKGGLDLRRRFTMLRGGDGGPAIVPGKPSESLLIEMLEKQEMPPKEEDPIEARQIELLRNWIAAGAPTRSAEEAPLDAADAEGIVSDVDRQFWAYQPPRRPPVPAVVSGHLVRNPVDSFLLEALEAKGLSFNAEAQKLVLLRRATFDLWGLPPTPELIQQFACDERPDAYERLIELLLASPRYGERWGRHWLDLAGYADSDGYLDADRERPEAWRFRDYVIRSLNDDKPFDQFVREQIAGDELYDWRRAETLTQEMQDALVATGFLRTASDPTYPGYKEQPEIHKVLADTMQILGSAFLGVTIHCARCHEHKSEPISQADYYRLSAVFAAALDANRWLASGERVVPLAPEARQDKNARAAARAAELEAELNALVERYRGRHLDERLAALGVPETIQQKLKQALLLPAEKRSEEQKQLLAAQAPGLAADEAAVVARFPELKPELDALRGALAAERALIVPVVAARGLVDLDDTPPTSHVLRRGDWKSKGRPVEPGVPAVFARPDFRFTAQPGYKSTGRRRALAEWLTSADHPTLARLHVNRVWAGHFGKGLVETVDDFGRSGKPPTHPALLDWLACEFMASGWSQKQLHRLLVTSAAYRQSTDYDPRKEAIDPENALWGARRPVRHQGEVLRDAILTVAGRLNPTMFGKPAPVTRAADGSVVAADGSQGQRRSLYLQVRRSQNPTLLEVFDTPTMEINCTRRTEAIVATQALALMNSPFAESASRALADRITSHAAERALRADFAFQLVYTRQPTSAERQALDRFVDEYVAFKLADQAATATRTEREAAESAAWVEAALVLLNTNEFLYVD
jgi:hypothetical protein